MAAQQKRLNRTQSTALTDWLRNNVGILEQHNVPALTDMASIALGFPISVHSLPYSAQSVGLRVGRPRTIVVKPAVVDIATQLADLRDDFVNVCLILQANISHELQINLLSEIIARGKK